MKTYDTTKYFEIKDSPKLKTSELMELLRKKHGIYSYWDDKELNENFPKPQKATTRYFNKSTKPDTKTLGMTCGELQKLGGMTFREYILMWLQSDEKFDVKGITVFSDSLPGGKVASGYWGPGNVKVRFS